MDYDEAHALYEMRIYAESLIKYHGYSKEMVLEYLDRQLKEISADEDVK